MSAKNVSLVWAAPLLYQTRNDGLQLNFVKGFKEEIMLSSCLLEFTYLHLKLIPAQA